jgi:hypothetical protein
MKLISFATLIGALPLGTEAALYETKNWGSAASPATDCSGTQNQNSPQYHHTDVCSAESLTTGSKLRVANGVAYVDFYSSKTCTGSVTQTWNYGTIGNCYSVLDPTTSQATGLTFSATLKEESQLSWTDVNVKITKLWYGATCGSDGGAVIPLGTQTDNTGKCTGTIDGFGDVSKVAELEGDSGFFYEKVYASADSNQACVGDYSTTNRYTYSGCNTLTMAVDGTEFAVSFTAESAAASLTAMVGTLFAGVALMTAYLM